MTYAQLLTEAMTAMQAAMAGQSYTVNGITYSRQNIDALQRLIDWLEGKAAGETAGSSSGGGQVQILI